MALHIKTLSFASMRELTRSRQSLPELEHGLLNRYGERLAWGLGEKSVLLDMAIQRLECKYMNMTLEIHVRYLCHSGAATAEYDRFAERFNMKRCVLLLGNVGQSKVPWAELIQPALDLYQREYNVLWIDVPAFQTNTGRWLKYGPVVIRGVLKFLTVKGVHVFATGVGGTLFMEMLSQGPSCLARTHFIHNMDFPRGSKVAPFDVTQLEDSLRDNPVQMWFVYQDEEESETGYNRAIDGTPRRAYEVINQIAARLAGERRRSGKNGGLEVNFDDVIMTEKLNMGKRECLTKAELGKNTCIVATPQLMISVATYFSQEPKTWQDDIQTGGANSGLIVDVRARVRATEVEEVDVLPSLWRLRAGPDPHERAAAAAANKRRSELMSSAALCLTPGAELERLRRTSMAILEKPVNQDGVLHGLRALSEMGRTDSNPLILAKRQEYVRAYKAQRAAVLHGFGAQYAPPALSNAG